MSGAVDVVAILGSPRPKGNTSSMVELALGEVAARGLTAQTWLLEEFSIRPCEGHDNCGEMSQCPINDDAVPIVQSMFDAPAVILASPVYSDNVSGQMKVFMDRCCHKYRSGIRLQAQVVGLLCASESTGLQETLECFRRFLNAQLKGPVPEYVASGHADKLGDALANPALVEVSRRLGRSIADEVLRLR